MQNHRDPKSGREFAHVTLCCTQCVQEQHAEPSNGYMLKTHSASHQKNERHADNLRKAVLTYLEHAARTRADALGAQPQPEHLGTREDTAGAGKQRNVELDATAFRPEMAEAELQTPCGQPGAHTMQE